MRSLAALYRREEMNDTHKVNDEEDKLDHSLEPSMKRVPANELEFSQHHLVVDPMLLRFCDV